MLSFSSRIEEPSQISEARRLARKLAGDIGFDETLREKVCIVVTEAATNLLKHAGGGQLLVRAADDHGLAIIEVLALDRGPGLDNVERCLRDGYSTTETRGTGLGAIIRLAQQFDIHSASGAGTALIARIGTRKNGTRADRSQLGVVQVPKTGEDVCGDHWGIRSVDGRTTLLMADGLGHGPDAAKAAHAAIDVLDGSPDLSPKELIERVHLALRATRGAAVAAAQLDPERRTLTFAGLGNISASVCAPGEHSRHMVSVNGTAGMEARNVRVFTYPWPQESLVILHSDGIGTHWDLQGYPGLAARDPGLVAGVIYRDHARGHDDATIVVCR